MSGLSGFRRRLGAALWSRTLEFLRDRSALGWNLVFPLLLVAGLGYVFSGPGQPDYSVAVLAPADAALDARLHPFLATPKVGFHREAELERAIARVQHARIDMVLDLREPPGRYWINPQSPKGLLIEQLLRGAQGPMPARATASGTAIRYVDWLVPGVLGMNMMFSCLYGLGYVIVRYRKNGYLKRLSATPLRAVEFVLAQLLSRLALVVAMAAVVYAGCDLLLGLRMQGSYALLLLTTMLGAFAMIAMGLIIAARISSEEFAEGLLNFIAWPMTVLCGVFFSLDGAPRALQLAAQALPLTHVVEAARAIMLDGAGLPDIAYHLGMLTAMSAGFVAIGAALFRWRQN